MIRDIFGNIIKEDLLKRKIPTRQIKREVLEESKRRGKSAEETAKFNASLQGIEYERTGKGHDFKAYRRNPFTGEKRFLGYREIKSSPTAPLSKLQKMKQKKMRGMYKVIRQNPDFW